MPLKPLHRLSTAPSPLVLPAQCESCVHSRQVLPFWQYGLEPEQSESVAHCRQRWLWVLHCGESDGQSESCMHCTHWFWSVMQMLPRLPNPPPSEALFAQSSLVRHCTQRLVSVLQTLPMKFPAQSELLAQTDMHMLLVVSHSLGPASDDVLHCSLVVHWTQRLVSVLQCEPLGPLQSLSLSQVDTQ